MPAHENPIGLPMMSPRVRASMDVITTLAILGTCAALLWNTHQRGRVGPPLVPVPSGDVSMDGAAIKGSREARIGLIMWTDYQCPFCARFERETLPIIEREYVATGRVLLAVRQHPLPAVHPLAFEAATVAVCAHRQGRFWDLHERLFQIQADRDPAAVRRIAGEAGLDMEAFAPCRSDPSAEARVRSDAETAIEFGLNGTPAFLIGALRDGGTMEVWTALAGARPTREFVATLDQALIQSDEMPSRAVGLGLTSVAVAACIAFGAWRVRRAAKHEGLGPWASLTRE